MGRFQALPDDAVELLPGIFPAEMGNLENPGCEVAEPTPTFDGPNRTLADRRFESVQAVDRSVDLGPDRTDAPRQVRIRRTEGRQIEYPGQRFRATGMDRQVLRIVHFDGVYPIGNAHEFLAGETDREEFRVWREHRRVLLGERLQCRLEVEEIRDRFLEPQGEYVSTVPPRSGEELPAGQDEKLRGTGSASAGYDVGIAGEMWRVHDGIQPTPLCPFEDPIVEDLDVEVDSRHVRGGDRGQLSRCGSSQKRLRYRRPESATMSPWACGIDDCEAVFEAPEPLILHQTTEHSRTTCGVCGETLPDGYFAIRHAFEEHSRAEFVRAYGASSTEVRERESIKDAIEAEADLELVIERLERAASEG